MSDMEEKAVAAVTATLLHFTRSGRARVLAAAAVLLGEYTIAAQCVEYAQAWASEEKKAGQ